MCVAVSTCLIGIPPAMANALVLPAPGKAVSLSPSFHAPVLKGIKFHPNDPFKFEFILDPGSEGVSSFAAKSESSLAKESTTLIKYFLAALTIPEKDLWVNLSPYENNRIVPDAFGRTGMGRDLLAQDYLLKQLSASLMNPNEGVGEEFWKKFYMSAAGALPAAQARVNTVNTFHKVWIVPDKAVVYQNTQAGTAYVVEQSLKVMLEEDYLAFEKNSVIASPSARNDTGLVTTDILRQVMIPVLTKEVNEGGNFAQLRQAYHSLILASWYKKKIKESILAQVYADQNKVKGVEPVDPINVDMIYARYIEAFKKGVHNFIREEPDLATGKVVPRKYFSGGFDFAMSAMRTVDELHARNIVLPNALIIQARLITEHDGETDQAMAPEYESSADAMTIATDLNGAIELSGTIKTFKDHHLGEASDALITRRLREWYVTVPVEVERYDDYAEAAGVLKDLHEERAQIERRMEAEEQSSGIIIPSLLTQWGDISLKIAKLQILSAGSIVSGKTRLQDRTMRHNALKAALDGILNSLNAFRDARRFQLRLKQQESRASRLESAGWVGDAVRHWRQGRQSVKLSLPSADPMNPEQLDLKRTKLFEMKRTLNFVIEWVREGNVALAIEKINDLIYAYTALALHMDIYRELVSSAHRINEVLYGMNEGEKASPDSFSKLERYVDTLRQHIVLPKYLAMIDNKSKGRSEQEFKEIIAQISFNLNDAGHWSDILAHVEFYIGRLTGRSPGQMPAALMKRVKNGISRIRTEVEKEPDTLHIKLRLQQFLALAEAALASQDINAVRTSLEGVQSLLVLRFKNIDRVNAQLRERAQEVYYQIREGEMSLMINAVMTLVEMDRLPEAKDTLQKLVDLYLTGEQSVPGFKRAQGAMRLLLINAVQGHPKGEMLKELERIKADLLYKYAYRVRVMGTSGMESDVYVPRGTTVRRLVQTLGRTRAFVRLNGREIYGAKASEWSHVLSDNDVIKFADRAMNTAAAGLTSVAPGGIDLTPARLNVEEQSEVKARNFVSRVDSIALQKFRSASGFTPVIIRIEPVANIKLFLGVEK